MRQHRGYAVDNRGEHTLHPEMRSIGPAATRVGRRVAPAAAGMALVAVLGTGLLAGCTPGAPAQDASGSARGSAAAGGSADAAQQVASGSASAVLSIPEEAALRSRLDLVESYRPEFSHGPKGAEFQRYIVLHDTEGDGTPEDVVNYWDSTDDGVAAHFVIGKDGHIVQCVPLDEIAHHAGFGDTGHNGAYGTTDESRDDKAGTEPIGSWAADYGMNSYSIGIEMIHIGGEGGYPAAQLDALDNLIAYIDAYYGTESQIIDHKAWRTGNSDTSAEFAGYLANYQDHRTHD